MQDILHHATIFMLLSQHGMDDYILLFAEIINDYDKVVQIHIDRGEFDLALNWIGRQVG
jgi:hypothetical protein